jgi:mannose-1-phosphate guanylyltransferase
VCCGAASKCAGGFRQESAARVVKVVGGDSMKAFLLAGGLGERLRPLTDRVPKCLVPINGVPLLSIWIDLCNRSGIDSVLINVSRHGEQVEAFLASEDLPIDVRIVQEKEPIGNAGTVLANRDFVRGEDNFFILYSDNLTDVPLARLLAFHRAHGGVFSMGLFHTPMPTSSGIVELSPEGRIRNFQEKPARPLGDLANAGIYVSGQGVFDAIPHDRPIVDFGNDVFPRLQGQLYGQLLDGYVRDIGTPQALAQGCRDWAARSTHGPSANLGASA